MNVEKKFQKRINEQINELRDQINKICVWWGAIVGILPQPSAYIT